MHFLPPPSPSLSAPASSPTNVSVTNNSPTSVSVTWEAPPTEDHNGMIRIYRLLLVEVGTGRNWTRSTTSTHFPLDFLEEDSNYIVRVAAETLDVGPYSDPTSFRTLPDGEPTRGRGSGRDNGRGQ